MALIRFRCSLSGYSRNWFPVSCCLKNKSIGNIELKNVSYQEGENLFPARMQYKNLQVLVILFLVS